MVASRFASAYPSKVAPQSASPGHTAIQACRRYTDRGWEELGYASLANCLQLAFRDNCNIANAQFGEVPLRRFNNMIQAQAQVGRWVQIAKAICLSHPPGQTPPAQAPAPGLLHHLWPWSSSRASVPNQTASEN
jgi:hypothetical protein